MTGDNAVRRMSGFPIPLLAALLLGLAAGPAPAQRERFEVAQVMVREQLIVHVPRLAPRARPVEWIEQKGPKCVPLAALAGALILQPDAVDLVLAGGGRVRARLDDDCPALDFYSGFYLKPTRDGKVCAGRDAVRSRAGRKCEIDRFRTLVAKR